MLINHISSLLAGFSSVGSLILLFAYLFFLPDMRKTAVGKIACFFVLTGLAILQVFHYGYFSNELNLIESRQYCTLLAIIPPAYFFFGREVLFPDVQYHWHDALHLLSPLISLILSVDLVPTFAFIFGVAYTFWFARLIYKLRDQRGRYKFELFFFGMFAIMAFMALLLALSLPILDPSIFYFTYSNAISLALVLIVSALLVFPELLSDLMMMTELAYAKSKLDGVNKKSKKDKLEQLMHDEKYYENEELSLATVADALNLSSHQLSELINTEYGYGFPKFIREHRVNAAKELLVAEPKTSILAISMMTGFKSQSSFYTAFKDSTGESPGHFRTINLR